MSLCHSFYWKPISPYLIHPNLSNGSICSSVYCLYVYLNNFVCVKERVRDDREREREWEGQREGKKLRVKMA